MVEIKFYVKYEDGLKGFKKHDLKSMETYIKNIGMFRLHGIIWNVECSHDLLKDLCYFVLALDPDDVEYKGVEGDFWLHIYPQERPKITWRTRIVSAKHAGDPVVVEVGEVVLE